MMKPATRAVVVVLSVGVAVMQAACGGSDAPGQQTVQPTPTPTPTPSPSPSPAPSPSPTPSPLWSERTAPALAPAGLSGDYAKIATASPATLVDELVVVGNNSVWTQRLPRSRFAPLHAYLAAPAMFFAPTVSGDSAPYVLGPRTVYFVRDGRVQRLGLAPGDARAPRNVSALVTACDLKSILALDAAGDDAWLEVYERGSAPDCDTAWAQAAARASEPPTVWVRGTMADNAAPRTLPAGVRVQPLSDRWRWVDAFAVAQPGVLGLAVWDRDLQPLGQVAGSAGMSMAEALPMAATPGDAWSWWRIGRSLHRLDWADRVPRLSAPLHGFDEPDHRRLGARLAIGEQLVFGDGNRMLLQRGNAPAAVLQVLASDESLWLVNAAPAGIVATTLDAAARTRTWRIAGGTASLLSQGTAERAPILLGGRGETLHFLRGAARQSDRELLAWSASSGWRTLASGIGNVIPVHDRDLPPNERTLDTLFECRFTGIPSGGVDPVCSSALARINLDTGARSDFSPVVFPARGIFGGFSAPRAFRFEGLILLQGLTIRFDATSGSTSVADVHGVSPDIGNSLRRVTAYGDN